MMVSAAVERQAELERVRLMQAFIAFFNEYDLLLTPCVPIAPFVAGHGINTPDAATYPEWYDWTPYTWVFNAAKLPAASCPWGLDQAGLPQAVQLAATYLAKTLCCGRAPSSRLKCRSSIRMMPRGSLAQADGDASRPMLRVC